ncbi:MAG: DUF1702 family protein [Candidatus Obscuribacterales bacterium]|nr:DUF1702 family protein [Candidatus Obscuribacterales bacterium]
MENLNKFISRCRSRLSIRRPVDLLRQEIRSPKQRRVDEIMRLVMNGYQASLECDASKFASQLSGLSPMEQNITLEGAYIALSTSDLSDTGKLQRATELFGCLSNGRIPPLLQGIGGALSHLRIPFTMQPHETNEAWGWLAMLGYGFHEGYFRWMNTLERMEIPQGISGLAQRAFDQGVGSATWYVGAGNPEAIARMISSFPIERQADMWSGAGLVVGIWGLEDSRDLTKLLNKARRYRANLQSGVAFGVWSRIDIKEIADYTDGASSLICGAPVNVIGDHVSGLLTNGGGPPKDAAEFLLWQSNVCELFARN